MDQNQILQEIGFMKMPMFELEGNFMLRMSTVLNGNLTNLSLIVQ